MCGLVGYWHPRNAIGPFPEESELRRAGRRLVHRGPDGEGLWLSPDSHAGVFHRRLAIIDLSERGRQPFVSSDGRVAMVANGEIYNFRELRIELEAVGHVFQSDSDCEVLLHGWFEWGEALPEKLDGMFAFLVVDDRKKMLFGARDRFGEKPLYWTRNRVGTLLFGSEIKSLAAFSGMELAPDQSVLNAYLAHNILPGWSERTFYAGVCRIMPATCFRVDAEGQLRSRKYWQPQIKRPSVSTPEEAGERWRELFDASLRLRRAADVPIGSSLSGGLDSSSVVCSLSGVNSNFTTFSARSADSDLDEGEFIEAVVEQCSSRHIDIWPRDEALESVIDRFAWHVEEPYHEATAMAAFSVFRAARENGVPVLLDGQGGDEMLCGYPEDYAFALLDIWQDDPLRAVEVNQQLYDSFFEQVGCTRGASDFTADSLMRLVGGDEGSLPKPVKSALREVRRQERPMVSQAASHYADLWASPEWCDSPVPTIPPLYANNSGLRPLQRRLLERLSGWEFSRFLDYVDRTSMAFGVEVRLPFLSPELVEFSLGLPAAWVLRGGLSKRVLRDAMQGVVPRKVLGRTDKRGFSCEQQQWIEGLDPDWLADRIAPARPYCSHDPEHYMETWRLLCASYVVRGWCGQEGI